MSATEAPAVDLDEALDELKGLWFEAAKRQYLVGGCHGNPWHYLGNEERLRSIALLRALGRPLDWQPEP